MIRHYQNPRVSLQDRWSKELEVMYFQSISPQEKKRILDEVELFVFGIHTNMKVIYMKKSVKKYKYTWLCEIRWTGGFYVGKILDGIASTPRIKNIEELQKPFCRTRVRYDSFDYASLFPHENNETFGLKLGQMILLLKQDHSDQSLVELAFILIGAYTFIKPHAKSLPCPYCGMTMIFDRVQHIAINLGGIPFSKSQLSVSCNCNYCSQKLDYTSYAFRCHNGHGLCIKCMRLELKELTSLCDSICYIRSDMPEDIAYLIAYYGLGFGIDFNDW